MQCNAIVKNLRGAMVLLATVQPCTVPEAADPISDDYIQICINIIASGIWSWYVVYTWDGVTTQPCPPQHRIVNQNLSEPHILRRGGA